MAAVIATQPTEIDKNNKEKEKRRGEERELRADEPNEVSAFYGTQYNPAGLARTDLSNDSHRRSQGDDLDIKKVTETERVATQPTGMQKRDKATLQKQKMTSSASYSEQRREDDPVPNLDPHKEKDSDKVKKKTEKLKIEEENGQDSIGIADLSFPTVTELQHCLSQAPYLIPAHTNHPVLPSKNINKVVGSGVLANSDLAISDDGSCHVYTYALPSFSHNFARARVALLKDSMEYCLATKGEIKNRRVCYVIAPSTSNTRPAALILSFKKPNYLLAKQFYALIARLPDPVNTLLKDIDDSTHASAGSSNSSTVANANMNAKFFDQLRLGFRDLYLDIEVQLIAAKNDVFFNNEKPTLFQQWLSSAYGTAYNQQTLNLKPLFFHSIENFAQTFPAAIIAKLKWDADDYLKFVNSTINNKVAVLTSLQSKPKLMIKAAQYNLLTLKLSRESSQKSGGELTESNNRTNSISAPPYILLKNLEEDTSPSYFSELYQLLAQQNFRFIYTVFSQTRFFSDGMSWISETEAIIQSDAKILMNHLEAMIKVWRKSKVESYRNLAKTLDDFKNRVPHNYSDKLAYQVLIHKDNPDALSAVTEIASTIKPRQIQERQNAQAQAEDNKKLKEEREFAKILADFSRKVTEFELSDSLLENEIFDQIIILTKQSLLKGKRENNHQLSLENFRGDKLAFTKEVLARDLLVIKELYQNWKAASKGSDDKIRQFITNLPKELISEVLTLINKPIIIDTPPITAKKENDLDKKSDKKEALAKKKLEELEELRVYHLRKRSILENLLNFLHTKANEGATELSAWKAQQEAKIRELEPLDQRVLKTLYSNSLPGMLGELLKETAKPLFRGVTIQSSFSWVNKQGNYLANSLKQTANSLANAASEYFGSKKQATAAAPLEELKLNAEKRDSSPITVKPKSSGDRLHRRKLKRKSAKVTKNLRAPAYNHRPNSFANTLAKYSTIIVSKVKSCAGECYNTIESRVGLANYSATVVSKVTNFAGECYSMLEGREGYQDISEIYKDISLENLFPALAQCAGMTLGYYFGGGIDGLTRFIIMNGVAGVEFSYSHDPEVNHNLAVYQYPINYPCGYQPSRMACYRFNILSYSLWESIRFVQSAPLKSTILSTVVGVATGYMTNLIRPLRIKADDSKEGLAWKQLAIYTIQSAFTHISENYIIATLRNIHSLMSARDQFLINERTDFEMQLRANDFGMRFHSSAKQLQKIRIETPNYWTSSGLWFSDQNPVRIISYSAAKAKNCYLNAKAELEYCDAPSQVTAELETVQVSSQQQFQFILGELRPVPTLDF